MATLLSNGLFSATPRALYDAFDLASLNDGDDVSQWNDLSGNGNHLTASAGSRPKYKELSTNIGDGVASAVQYERSSKVMLSTLNAWTTNTAVAWIVCLYDFFNVGANFAGCFGLVKTGETTDYANANSLTLSSNALSVHDLDWTRNSTSTPLARSDVFPLAPTVIWGTLNGTEKVLECNGKQINSAAGVAVNYSSMILGLGQRFDASVWTTNQSLRQTFGGLVIFDTVVSVANMRLNAKAVWEEMAKRQLGSAASGGAVPRGIRTGGEL